MKKVKILLPVVLALAVLIPMFASVLIAAEQNDAEYKAALIASGFPEDYAEGLLKLHKKHPNWTFEPLDVTGLSGGTYTWSYVIGQETNEPKRSLVSKGDSYFTLRDWNDFNLYDSGWYKASVPAVEYMMDPRNFLDEEQIFQFYDLAWSDTVTLDAVKAAVRGTFMEDAKLDGEYADMTYAEYFMQIGRELGANPVYLAAKVRNEQGVNGTSPLISGECGDQLWYYYSNKMTGTHDGKLINAPTSGFDEESLKKFNGYYNYFNIGAAGTGYFAIYKGGMTEAMTGTATMAEKWGGPAWNTRWKALYGGAYTATQKYINDYQNTSYLQKFNVDARSGRNFWGQYMQNIHGAHSAAKTFARSFRENGMLDLPYSFCIPVYAGMPASCPYPDGTEFSGASKLRAADVASFDYVDISALKGVKSSYPSGEITWRVLPAGKGTALDLGEIDVTKYSGVYIEYSVAKSFDILKPGKRAILGLVTDPDHLYQNGGDDYDLTRDLGHGNMTDGNANGYLSRKVMNVDLRGAAYQGHVYLTAYLADGQTILIHNIVFYTRTNYDPAQATELVIPPETDAPTEPPTEAPTEEPGTDASDEKGCGSVLGFACVLPALAVTNKKRKK